MALHWRRTIIISLFLAFLTIDCVASTRNDTPSSTAIMVDVPVRILGAGLTIVSGDIFFVNSPYTLNSRRIEDTWK